MRPQTQGTLCSAQTPTAKRRAASLAMPYRVLGFNGVTSSRQNPCDQSYSAQLPATTAFWPPERQKASTNRTVASVQRRFRGEVQYLPCSAYHAICKRCVAPDLETKSAKSHW